MKIRVDKFAGPNTMTAFDQNGSNSDFLSFPQSTTPATWHCEVLDPQLQMFASAAMDWQKLMEIEFFCDTDIREQLGSETV